MRKGEIKISGSSADRVVGLRWLAYTEWGKADNMRAVICVHGKTRNGHDFDRFAEELGKNHRLISVDLSERRASNWLREVSSHRTKIE